MANFYKRLSYSLGNEDWSTEKKALQIQPDNHVLCVTASGDRPLHVLLEDCKQVTAIDINPIQNYLLELKMAAIRHLNYDRYISFLGITPDKHRLECFRSFASDLSIEARQFWQENLNKIEQGIIYQGAVEQLCKKFSYVLSVLRGKKIRHLFEINDIEEQRNFIHHQWDTVFWRSLFHVGLHPVFSKLIIKDPGLYAHIDNSLHPGKYIYQRMYTSLMKYLAKENLLLSLVFKGEISQEALSPYLKEENFQVLKERIDRISISTYDIIKYLHNIQEETFDRFSLSDVASYINNENFRLLAYGIYRTAKSNGRFSIRELMTYHQVPRDLQYLFLREYKLEKDLEKEDRCFVYRFMTGTIKKSSQVQ